MLVGLLAGGLGFSGVSSSGLLLASTSSATAGGSSIGTGMRRDLGLRALGSKLG